MIDTKKQSNIINFQRIKPIWSNFFYASNRDNASIDNYKLNQTEIFDNAGIQTKALNGNKINNAELGVINSKHINILSFIFFKC